MEEKIEISDKKEKILNENEVSNGQIIDKENVKLEQKKDTENFSEGPLNNTEKNEESGTEKNL